MRNDLTIINIFRELVAKQTLNQYYSRGGHGNGDKSQLLEGANFINTIGYSLSLVPNIELKNWSADHFHLAREGSLYYYEGKNLEPVEQIVTKLQQEAKGSREVFVTILPVSFYYTNSLFTLPLFRFKPLHDEKEEKFMDHTGRVYQNFEDWKSNNTLPATQILYPRDGHLKLKENEEGKPDCVLENSAECARPVKTLIACDIASGALGIAAGIGATVATGKSSKSLLMRTSSILKIKTFTGGAALLLMGGMALSATYGAGRAGFKLRDRAKHSESINPFKSREAFWVWLGLGADVVTFGTIGVASAKILSSISQGAAFVEISKRFAAAIRVMTIFSGTARPVTDSAKALLTGYEVFIKLRHKSTNDVLKLPKSALMQLNDSMDEFSELNMLMMAITEGFWSKSKMSYVSPEEFQNMVQETIIAHMTDQCTDKALFTDMMSLVQNDAALIDMYKHLDEGVDLDTMVQVVHDIFSANDDKMEIKLVEAACEIKVGSFHLNIKPLASLNKEERFKIVGFLKGLSEDQKARFLTVQDYVGSNPEFLKMLANDNALQLIEIWYDVFVICFDEHLATIPNENIIRLRNLEIPIDVLKMFSKEERLNIIFALKSFTEVQSENFKKLIEVVSDPERYYKVLSVDDEKKQNLITALEE